MDNLSLVPQPRSINFTTGQLLIEPGRFILLEAKEPAQLLFSARSLHAALQQATGAVWPISASATGPAQLMGIVLR
jgi:hypothetical protein